MNKSDIIVIGSGPGGYRAADYAARQGLSVVIIEAAEVGGTCLNKGCIPTKTLCRNAEIANTMRMADTFGLTDADYKIDFSKVVERKKQVVSQLRSGIDTLMRQPGITFIHGFAHFKDKNTVVVDGDEYTAKNIIIATGSDSKCPPIKGIELPGVLTSTELLDIDYIPEKLCIIGAGVIGMEFASIFSSFGSNVMVIEFLKECLPMLDSDIAKRLRQAMSKRGVEFNMQSTLKSISQITGENGKRKLSVVFDKKGKIAQTEADIILIATGRKPNIEGLNLERVGIEYSSKGIATDDDFQTNIEGIYAIGDVNGKCMLAHAATFQGIYVINHILGKTDNIKFNIMPSAIFTNPEAASVGLNEEQLKAEGRAYECKKGFHRANGKAIAMNEPEGMVKLFTDPTDNGRIIGCHAFGAHSSDMIQEIAALMNKNTTINQLADMIHIHPTISEILHDIAL